MNKNLENYVKILPGFIDPISCDKILEEIEHVGGWQQHQYHNTKDDETNAVNGEKELDVNWNSIPASEFMHDRVAQAIRVYLDDLNFFWYKNSQAFSRIRFNRYRENCVMNTHPDHIHTLFEGEARGIPVLTVLGALNDDYEGGELIMFEDTVVPMPKGSIVIFPSVFLYPHKVNPVIKGVRYSFVSWVW
jgi:predicted 2-oxoglutarate/Fe(II)-dependent dioxygenase YbiX